MNTNEGAMALPEVTDEMVERGLTAACAVQGDPWPLPGESEADIAADRASMRAALIAALAEPRP